MEILHSQLVSHQDRNDVRQAQTTNRRPRRESQRLSAARHPTREHDGCSTHLWKFFFFKAGPFFINDRAAATDRVRRSHYAA